MNLSNNHISKRIRAVKVRCESHGCFWRQVFVCWMMSAMFVAGIRSAAASVIYISPSGNDNRSGARDEPVATPARARDLARIAYKSSNSVTIVLKAGTYYLEEPLVLGPEDSGTKEAPVVWRSEDGETAVISGGASIAPKWRPYKNGIFQTPVPAGRTFDQFFVNGERQILARYPNYDPDQAIFNGYAADAISPRRAADWADPRGGILHALHQGRWGGFHYLITGKDAEGKVQYEGGWQGNRAGRPHPTYRFVENIFEELDAPGEWFLDGKSNTLYFYPPKGIELDKAECEIARLENLVEFRGDEKTPVRFINFQNITFRHTLRTFMQTKEPILRSDWRIFRGGAILFNGAEDCMLSDVLIDRVGGNAFFVSGYNRRITIRDSRVDGAGASSVVFIGGVDAVRNPLLEYSQKMALDQIDRSPGPKSDNYPSDCRVEGCLLTNNGRVEKQSAAVTIDMAARIYVSHCSIYGSPRAGINIGDGCWGGHVIEYCDIFDTVLETGDHGSFNSWGRDRYWVSNIDEINKRVKTEPGLPLLDALETNVIHDNRWRCDHGWDIDLDDGSSNYHIYNNLCLNGGIKLREGYYRVCENNICLRKGIDIHCWPTANNDILQRNIISTRVYGAARMQAPPPAWGAVLDNQLVHVPGKMEASSALDLQQQSGRDEHSIEADARFVDPARGDFRVKGGSPALGLGFKNFSMDQFGVTKPSLKAIAHMPRLPAESAAESKPSKPDTQVRNWLGVSVRNIAGQEEMSAFGLQSESGALIVDIPTDHAFAKAGLWKGDVVLGLGNQPVEQVQDLFNLQEPNKTGQTIKARVYRNQTEITVQIPFITQSNR
jgi:PDZ domain